MVYCKVEEMRKLLMSRGVNWMVLHDIYDMILILILSDTIFANTSKKILCYDYDTIRYRSILIDI